MPARRHLKRPHLDDLPYITVRASKKKLALVGAAGFATGVLATFSAIGVVGFLLDSINLRAIKAEAGVLVRDLKDRFGGEENDPDDPDDPDHDVHGNPIES